LADHFLDMGDLTNALKCYSRSRDYCSSTKHIISLCLNVIKVNDFNLVFEKNLLIVFLK
jgi:COP9 signalosome complex subunit 1